MPERSVKLEKREWFLDKNLTYLIKKSPYDSNTVAKSAKVAPASLFRMKSNRNVPSITSVINLANFFEVTLEDFVYEDFQSPEYQAKSALGPLIHVPMYEFSMLKDGRFREEKTSEFVAYSSKKEQALFAIKLESDFYLPVFSRNTILIVDANSKPKDSDYLLCQRPPNEAPLLRQVFIDGQTHFLKPLNSAIGPMQEVAEYHSLGAVLHAIEVFR